MAVKDSIWIVFDRTETGAFVHVEAHASMESAEAASKLRKQTGSVHTEVQLVDLKGTINKATATKAKKSKANDNAKVKSLETVDDSGDDNSSPTSKATKDSHEIITDGKPDALKGLKITFIGTMSKSQSTYEATAVTYGAEVTNNIKKADYVVLGTKPGPKKKESMDKHSVETITEEQFLDMLKSGIPEDKRKKMAAAAAMKAAVAAGEANGEGQPPKKKQKKQ